MTEEEETITLVDIIIIVDTLLGSCRIGDTMGLWKYAPEGRRQLAEKLLRISEGVSLDDKLEETKARERV